VVLYGPTGDVISSQFKKASPPKTGEAFGRWSGDQDLYYHQLPGGGVIGFDLNALNLSDFRSMTNHYQIHASLSVLSFMLHQSDWRIEHPEAKVRNLLTENLEAIWTSLTRALSTSHWAGFAPNVLQWENSSGGGPVVTELAKIKDLVPEDCYVNWKEVPGYAPPGKVKPKLKIYDGIKQWGFPYPIPTEASIWYPLLMENGNFYGKKLLKPAFIPWYFSMLLHLFANRYYERFGEPVPVGRAPMDEEVVIRKPGDTEDTVIGSRDYMLSMLQGIRSRSAVVLPGDRNPDDMSRATGSPSYEYDISYLESQMRGADFERYMTRLDEEMSIGLFTPILLMRTADVGSYNLGVGHMQVYLWMLNALNGDRAFYINKYILSRMVDYNFSPNAPRAKIIFRKMGNSNMETIRAVLQQVLSNKQAKPDIEELGHLAGLKLSEIRELTTPPPDPNKPEEIDPGTDEGDDAGNPGSIGGGSPKDTVANMKERVRGQARKGFANNNGWKPDLGYKKQLQQTLHSQGKDPSLADAFFDRMGMVLTDMQAVRWAGPDQFMEVLEPMLDTQLEEVLSAA
jgi:hypothetical protein